MWVTEQCIANSKARSTSPKFSCSEIKRTRKQASYVIKEGIHKAWNHKVQGVIWSFIASKVQESCHSTKLILTKAPSKRFNGTVHMVSCYEIHDEEDNSKPSPKHITPLNYMPKKPVQRSARRHDTMKATNCLDQEGAKFPPRISVFHHIKALSFSPSRISAFKRLSARPTQNQNALACRSAIDQLGTTKASIIGCSEVCTTSPLF